MAASNNPVKPRIFIGSSVEQLEAANEIQVLLRHEFHADVWSAGTFKAGSRPLDDLAVKAGKADYGIFVFGPDDRLFSREAEYSSTRDNVIFELGLFMGKLGIDKCFVIAPNGIDNLRIPTDLLGYAVEYYDVEHAKDNLPAALNPCCTNIKRVIRERRDTSASNETLHHVTTASQSSSDILKSMRDIVDQISDGNAGVSVQIQDESELRRWAEVTLANVRHLLKQHGDVPHDASFTWLRPTSDRGTRRLEVFASINLDDAAKHYHFALGEGLAGSVWKDGVPRMHSPSHQFAGWTIRPGCENQTYICVGVGEPAGKGGVLGAGSDSGFEPSEKQFELLQTFASTLAITAATETN